MSFAAASIDEKKKKNYDKIYGCKHYVSKYNK